MGLTSYNPIANGDVIRIDKRPEDDGGPCVWGVIASDPARHNCAVAYLQSHGYRRGWHDDGRGGMVEGWQFTLHDEG
jgi:hypothetical protein